MTPTNKAILFTTAALAASASAPAFNDCAPGQCGTTPGGATTTTVTVAPNTTVAPVTDVNAAAQAAALAAAKAKAKAEAAALAYQNLQAQLNVNGKVDQTVAGKVDQTVGNVTAESKAVGGNLGILIEAEKAVKPAVNSAYAYAPPAGICSDTGGFGLTLRDFSVSFSGAFNKKTCIDTIYGAVPFLERQGLHEAAVNYVLDSNEEVRKAFVRSAEMEKNKVTAQTHGKYGQYLAAPVGDVTVVRAIAPVTP